MPFGESRPNRVRKKTGPLRGPCFLFSQSLVSELYGTALKQKTRSSDLVFFYLYSERDLNPHGHCCPLDFKSNVSTNSTIRATLNGVILERKTGFEPATLTLAR